jgi:hypothetical protein
VENDIRRTGRWRHYHDLPLSEEGQDMYFTLAIYICTLKLSSPHSDIYLVSHGLESNPASLSSMKRIMADRSQQKHCWVSGTCFWQHRAPSFFPYYTLLNYLPKRVLHIIMAGWLIDLFLFTHRQILNGWLIEGNLTQGGIVSETAFF